MGALLDDDDDDDECTEDGCCRSEGRHQGPLLRAAKTLSPLLATVAQLGLFEGRAEDKQVAEPRGQIGQERGPG